MDTQNKHDDSEARIVGMLSTLLLERLEPNELANFSTRGTRQQLKNYLIEYAPYSIPQTWLLLCLKGISSLDMERLKSFIRTLID